MFLWIVATVLISAAAVLLSAPFIWRYAVRHSTAAAFRARAEADRMKQVEISPPGPIEADGKQSALGEVKTPRPTSDHTTRQRLSKATRIWGGVAVSLIVVFVSIGIYRRNSDPPVGANPSSAKLSLLPLTPLPTSLPNNPQLFPKESAPADRSLEQLVQSDSGTQAAPKANRGLPPVDELIERLIARLRQNPKDIGGWKTLGWSYLNLQRYDEAAAAYAKGIELNPFLADLHSARGEALVKAANGTVTAESKQAFAEALRLDSMEARARFYNGLAKSQSGDKAGALAVWIDIAKDVGTNDSTVPALKQSIADLTKELGAAGKPDRTSDTAAEKAPGQSKDRDISLAPAATGQPDSKPDNAVAPSAPVDQDAMIRGMVDGLAARLERSPRDVDGWVRLIRSRQVLNGPEAAREALDRALKVFEPSPERDRLVTAVKELGLSP